MNDSPIFIHSLFRSGSTYLFQVFRRSLVDYCCFQEALHEYVNANRLTPNVLLEVGEKDAKINRHPSLDSAYWSELVEIWPSWKHAINDEIIYEEYFPDINGDSSVNFWLVLTKAAKGRPVFQECRTSGRIGAIKGLMGGAHIYLWRNPWDQWWSYKVTPYFDVANQLIVHARNVPLSVRRMLAELNLPCYESSDLAESFAFYNKQPLSSEQSYLVFYHLWCLGLREGTVHADLMLNIDRLSDSVDYQSECLARLKDAGITGINFSDCQVPQGRYLERDRKFFDALEGRVHQWLKAGGWTQEELDKTQALRLHYQPASWTAPTAHLAPADLTEQACRARELAIRFETNLAQHARTAVMQLNQLESRAHVAETQAQQAEARAETHQQHANALQIQLQLLQSKIDELGASNHHWWQQACALEAERNTLRQSASWRITAPLRFAAGQVTHPLRTLRSGANVVIHRTICITERPLSRLMAAVLRRPQLSHRINHWLLRYPALYQQLIGVARRGGVVPGAPVYSPPAGQVNMHASPDLASLTPRARQIYADLQAAIKNNKGTS